MQDRIINNGALKFPLAELNLKQSGIQSQLTVNIL